MSVPQVGTHIHIFGDARKGDAHKMELMLLEHFHFNAFKVLHDLWIDNQTVVETIHCR